VLKRSILSLLLSGALVAPGAAIAQTKTEISFLRFFGGCAESVEEIHVNNPDPDGGSTTDSSSGKDAASDDTGSAWRCSANAKNASV